MRHMHIATAIALFGLLGLIAVIHTLTQTDIRHVTSGAPGTEGPSVSAEIAKLRSSFTTTYAGGKPAASVQHSGRRDKGAKQPPKTPLRLVYSSPHPIPLPTHPVRPWATENARGSKVVTLPQSATPTAPAAVAHALRSHRPQLAVVRNSTVPKKAPRIWPPKLTLLSVLPATIRRGTSATLCVIARGARILRVNGLGSLDPNHADCVAVAPQNSTTYVATATNASGRSTRRSVTLTVVDASAPASAAATNDASTP